MGGDVGGIEREYRRRRSPWRRMVLLAFVTTNFALQTFRHSNGLPVWFRSAMFVLVTGILGWAALSHFRGRTSVGPDGIAVRRAVRTRTHAWHDIYDIRVEPTNGRGLEVPQWLSYLYDNDGRRTRLPQVDDREVPALLADIESLRTAAARHRGMPFDRRPEVESRIRRRAGHRKAWERAFTGTALVLLAMPMVLFAELMSGAEVRPVLLLAVVPAASFVLLAALLNWRWESQVPAHLRASDRI